jgi:hypothetical protein
MVERLTPQHQRHAHYYNKDDCVMYLAHLPFHLSVVSTLTLGEDNDCRNRWHRCKRRAFGGGGALVDRDPGVADNSSNDSIN